MNPLPPFLHLQIKKPGNPQLDLWIDLEPKKLEALIDVYYEILTAELMYPTENETTIQQYKNTLGYLVMLKQKLA